MDAVEEANSGHPGAPMGMAPMAYALWTDFLKHNPADPGWFDRDRFILSAGHASMLLYSLLHLTGYEVPMNELKRFRQWGSKTAGHPEHGLLPGIETTTGPLGQGIATGVGMAMAERYLSDRFNRNGLTVINHTTYAIVSDGDLMEGLSGEAASLAGHLRLGKLICLYDSNSISIDGPTSLAFTEDVGARFRAYGWHVQRVQDGNDLDAIRRAITAARRAPRPSMVEVRTHIGYGAPTKQDSADSHGAPLGAEEVRGAKQRLGWDPEARFAVPPEATARFGEALAKGAAAQARWQEVVDEHSRRDQAAGVELARVIAGELPDGWDQDLPHYPADAKGVSTRKASGAAINSLARRLPELIGGSADLAESNQTEIKGEDSFGPGCSGRNIHFGVREHAMGAALNGISLHGGLRAFGGTFLIFSDYMRPAIRLASLMHAPSIFVFSHDSIGLGEDGPTHQPIEHLASLRAMPNLVVLRPGDANETVEAWRFATAYRGGPVALLLTRQNLPVFAATAAERPPVARGAYVLRDAKGGVPDVVLIATGSEVHLAVEAAGLLAVERVSARVVSMPSWELFERQEQGYRDSVLPPAVTARVAVEAASTFGWQRWVGDGGAVVGIDHFGASAPGGEVMRQFGFTAEHVADAARTVVLQHRGAPRAKRTPVR